jgi:hypothetical protein
MSKYLALLIVLFSGGSYAQSKPLVVEEWLFAVVDAKPLSGPVRYFSVDELPTPPIFVRAQKGDQVQVLLRRLGGIYWLPRYAVRLSQEDALQLICQDNLKSRQAQYRTYGMRGLEEASTGLKCITPSSHKTTGQTEHKDDNENE